ncbi:sensor histidine kinase [Polymorphospora sp. NPDC051019]|uniref:sensor histidine kinase n=1 Tax=Polymorphospora sp. NPDC051019 TaxID=3155725 RepID=UPI003441E354
MTDRPVVAPPRGSQWHEALFYTGDDDYLETTVPFVEAGLAAGEPVLIAVPAPGLHLLRRFDGVEGVRLVDMVEAGRNPARIIPGVLHAFTASHPGRPVRVVGEPIWPGRAAADYPRCVQHEALVNLAFADQPVRILCPYDAVRLDLDVLADAASTHPVLTRGGDRRASLGYAHPERIVDAFNRPLPEPGTPATVLVFEAAGLSGVRGLVVALATEAGLRPGRVTDLRIAVNELATNAVANAPGPAVLRVWTEPDGLLCEITGSSVLTDRLAGRIPPPHTTERGRGLLLVNLLCDLVHVHTTDDSTTVRLLMDR